VSALEHRNRLAEVSLASTQTAERGVRRDTTEGLTDVLGDPKSFLGPGRGVHELPQLGERPGQIRPRHHRGQRRHPEPLTAQSALQGRETLREEVDRAPIGAQDVVDPAQARARLNTEGHVIEALGEVEAALAEFNGAPMVSQMPDLGPRIRRDPRSTMATIQRRGEGVRSSKIVEDPLELAERVERVAQVKAEIHSLLEHTPALREVLQRDQRLLEAGDGL
jgi:hypothetical protein